MGLFSGIKGAWDDFRGATGARAAKRAGEMQGAAYDQIGGMYQPFTGMATEAMPMLQEGATAGGMMGSLGEIMGGGGPYSQMVDERQRAATAAMSNAGLRRSGAAIKQAGNIPAEIAMQLEGELQRRRESNMGFGMNALANQTNAIGSAATARAGGDLGAAQSRSQGIGNIIGLAGQAGRAIAGAM